jgi:hypothetical protein
MQDDLMDMEINLESLTEYLTQRYHYRDIELYGFKIFLEELRYRNFKVIGEVHKALERTETAVELFEKDFPPNHVVGSQYSTAGIARISMCLLDSNFTLREMILTNISSEKLEKYRKLILPDFKQSQNRKQ